MRLANPSWLLLLVLMLWPFLAMRWKRRVVWSSLTLVPKQPRGLAGWLRHLPNLLRSLAVGLLIVALARPQTMLSQIVIKSRGVAIVVALDQSASMMTADFSTRPLGDRGFHEPRSRFDAAKLTLESFILGRPNDLIGLVAFATFPDLTCPPTLDHAFLVEATRALRPALPGESSTNLGDAVAVSLDALKSIPSPKKVLILLTDGHDAPGVPSPLDPLEAAKLAADLGITLHTIAIGKPGGVSRAYEPKTGLRPVIGIDDGPDLDLLQAMSELGGGRAFEASDMDALSQVFVTLDQLERVELTGTIRTRYREDYGPWLAGGLLALVFERLLRAGRWQRL